MNKLSSSKPRPTPGENQIQNGKPRVNRHGKILQRFTHIAWFTSLSLGLATNTWALNLNPTLSDAGLWVPVRDNTYLSALYNGQLANTFHALIPLGASGQYGMVVTGWGYSGWPPTLSQPAPVSMAILSPDSSGNLAINTSAFIADPVTNGSGSAIVADFNGDGKPDIFLAAHNESPFIAMPSTAYLSNSGSGLTKVTLNDQVMAHDAELVTVNGKPTVVTITFGPGDYHPSYTFTNGQFVEDQTSTLSTGNSSGAITAGNFGPNGELEVIGSDSIVNYNPTTGFGEASNIHVYSGTEFLPDPLQIITPYLSTLPQYQTTVSYLGPGITHTYRLWSDDLNHDGREDILAGESMWSQSNPGFPSALQALINKGDGTFQDATAALNPDMNLNTAEMDYTPTFIDIDHSGIKTFLFAGSTSWGSVARQSDYVILNDGTGRLHIGMHDEFTQLASKVYSFLGMTLNSNSTPPRFIAIPQPDGSLNFVAEVPSSTWNAAVGITQSAYKYVNVPVHFNPSTDFTRNIIVNNRNSSKLMRTWAGNDTFYDTNASTAVTTIDGGLGMNKSVYSGYRNSYTVERNVDGTVSVIGNGLSDRLKNIQTLQFLDQTVSGVPNMVTISAVTPGPGTAAFNFSTAGGNGQLITYTVTCTSPNHATQSASGTSSPIVVRALAGGVAYTCSITASNGMASSPPSPAVMVTAGSVDLSPILLLLLD